LAKIHASADYIFYQSNFCKISADHFLGKTQGQWEILYNAVDTEKFTPRKEILKNDPLVLLLGGNQFAYYRVECALKVLSLLVDRGVNAKLCITGRLGWRKLDSPSGNHSAPGTSETEVASKPILYVEHIARGCWGRDTGRGRVPLNISRGHNSHYWASIS